MKVAVTTVITYEIVDDPAVQLEAYSTNDPDEILLVEKSLIEENGDYLISMMSMDESEVIKIELVP